MSVSFFVCIFEIHFFTNMYLFFILACSHQGVVAANILLLNIRFRTVLLGKTIYVAEDNKHCDRIGTHVCLDNLFYQIKCLQLMKRSKKTTRI